MINVVKDTNIIDKDTRNIHKDVQKVLNGSRNIHLRTFIRTKDKFEIN